MPIFRRRANLGLDIGSHGLHLAVAQSRSQGGQVWSSPTFAERASKEDRPTNEAVTYTLKKMLELAEGEARAWSQNAIVGIQGHHVACGYLEHPQLVDDELDMAVMSHVSREVPFPIDSLDVVHLPVEALRSGGRAVFYSTWKKVVGEGLRRLCGACGLKILRLEATCVALTRELYRNRALDPQRFQAIVNIGFTTTMVVITRAGYPYYVRDIPLGTRDFIYAIEVGGQMSWLEAEQMLTTHPLYELTPTTGPILSELSYELSRSLTYFQRRFGQSEIEAVYLSGGGALIKDYADWLEEELKAVVRREQWQQLKVYPESASACLHKISLGLALG